MDEYCSGENRHGERQHTRKLGGSHHSSRCLGDEEREREEWDGKEEDEEGRGDGCTHAALACPPARASANPPRPFKFWISHSLRVMQINGVLGWRRLLCSLELCDTLFHTSLPYSSSPSSGCTTKKSVVVWFVTDRYFGMQLPPVKSVHIAPFSVSCHPWGHPPLPSLFIRTERGVGVAVAFAKREPGWTRRTMLEKIMLIPDIIEPMDVLGSEHEGDSNTMLQTRCTMNFVQGTDKTVYC